MRQPVARCVPEGGEIPLRTHSDALACNIATRLGACSHDELRVLDRVLSGLEDGRHVYGPLDISRDPRSYINEAAMECRDLVAYLAMHEVAQHDYRIEQLQREAAEEISPARDSVAGTTTAAASVASAATGLQPHEHLSPVELGLAELVEITDETQPRERFDVTDVSEGG
jgi:hypothetical protein